MQEQADREARDLCDAIKALGLEGVSVRGWAYPPSTRTRQGYRAGSRWGDHWCLIIRVRWRDMDLTVEHLDNVPLYAEMTARSTALVLRGAYSEESYRFDRQRERTLLPAETGVTPRARVDRRYLTDGSPLQSESPADS